MNTQDDTLKSVDVATDAHEYSAPAVLSAVKVTDVVRGGTGIVSDGGGRIPL